MAATLFERQMAMYTTYHRDHRNRLTHFFGIPAIIVSLMVVLSLGRVEIGTATLSLALWIGGAIWGLWIALDRPIGFAIGVFMIPCFLLSERFVATQATSTAWSVFAVLFVGGWALQLWGHFYEGRRPALMSNLFQALIGPMFLVAEIYFALGMRRDLKERVEKVVRENYPQFAERSARPTV